MRFARGGGTASKRTPPSRGTKTPSGTRILQNDGNLIIHDEDVVTALWNSGTWGH
ncbi:hypothetical protein [Corallococcus llansteffanensis]|uniref:hypothetical protein n=1 Tax=Corallococcus llansteffanensis TaxID=2316731 RepID=UPI001315908D|nr:hypothetical protein [Corallococcus llansteffanensis]